MMFEDFTDLTGDRTITWEVWWKKYGVGAQAFGANSGHGRTHAELSRFIRGGADYGAIAAPRDNNGRATELWIVALLHRRIKRVHVNVDDLASGHVGNP